MNADWTLWRSNVSLEINKPVVFQCPALLPLIKKSLSADTIGGCDGCRQGRHMICVSFCWAVMCGWHRSAAVCLRQKHEPEMKRYGRSGMAHTYAYINTAAASSQRPTHMDAHLQVSWCKLSFQQEQNEALRFPPGTAQETNTENMYRFGVQEIPPGGSGSQRPFTCSVIALSLSIPA